MCLFIFTMGQSLESFFPLLSVSLLSQANPPLTQTSDLTKGYQSGQFSHETLGKVVNKGTFLNADFFFFLNPQVLCETYILQI